MCALCFPGGHCKKILCPDHAPVFQAMVCWEKSSQIARGDDLHFEIKKTVDPLNKIDIFN